MNHTMVDEMVSHKGGALAGSFPISQLNNTSALPTGQRGIDLSRVSE